MALDPAIYLKKLGEAGDGPHDLAEAALMLASLDHGGTALEPYIGHLKEISAIAREEICVLPSAESAAHALAALLAGRYGYDGDRVSYNAPQNADLMAVIDRRRGLPVSLGILYIHAARAAGFAAEGLNSPGHFLLRLCRGDDDVLLDPFHGGLVMDSENPSASPRLSAMAEQLPQSMEPVSDTDVLLRLQNNLRLRALNAKDMIRARDISRRMALIGPRRKDLWLELAHLEEATGSLGAASKAYEAVVLLSMPGEPSLNEAALALQALKRKLN